MNNHSNHKSYSLKNICPDCPENLFAYWHTLTHDQGKVLNSTVLGIGYWKVECINCGYELEHTFLDKESLESSFTIELDDK
jgi:hypothetical protein